MPRGRPVLERIVEERDGEIKLVKVNIDEEQEHRPALRDRLDPDDDPLQGRRAGRGRDRRAAERPLERALGLVARG